MERATGGVDALPRSVDPGSVEGCLEGGGVGEGRGFVHVDVALQGRELSGDVVRTRDGEVLQGSIAAETSAGVIVRTREGVTRFVPTAALAGVERADADPLDREEYQVRLAMARRTVRGYYELAFWARERGLNREASECFERALQLNPDHAASRKELGWRAIDGRWVSAEAFQADGGDVRLLGVTEDGWVRLRFVGACHGCAAQPLTIRGAVEPELRRRHAWVRGVRVEAPAPGR